MREDHRQAPEIAANENRQATVLVVEDEVLLRMLLADELRGGGFSVKEAINADEALAILNSGIKVDLLLTDVQMPGALDGNDLATVVRRAFPSIKILIASAHAERCDTGLVDGSFDKPYDLVELCRRIRELLGNTNHEPDRCNAHTCADNPGR